MNSLTKNGRWNIKSVISKDSDRLNWIKRTSIIVNQDLRPFIFLSPFSFEALNQNSRRRSQKHMVKVFKIYPLSRINWTGVRTCSHCSPCSTILSEPANNEHVFSQFVGPCLSATLYPHKDDFLKKQSDK